MTIGEESIDPTTWAGSIPQQHGTAPHVRFGRSRWFNLLWLIPAGFVVLISAVAVAKGLRNNPSVERFIARNPGTTLTPEALQNQGFPWWVGAQHFLNMFLMIFIIRSGAQILADHPRLYWTRHSTPGKEWFRVQKEVPNEPLWTAKEDSVGLPRQVGLPGLRHTIGLARWWHLGTDVVWLLNGAIFYVLLFTTWQWRRVVPTTWDIIPNSASALLQYLSLDWPTEHGWVAYNGLQMTAYFITIFIAAPLALVTGLGMSPALSTRFRRVSKVLSIQAARSMHFLVLCWFLFFIVIHVTLVFTTGLLKNLNHIYGGSDSSSWLGFGVFAATMVLVIVAWAAATPFTLRHPRTVQRVGYALIGPVQRLFEHVDTRPGEYSEGDISPYFWHNGQYPDRSEQYNALRKGDFSDYRLEIAGLVDNPVELSLADLRALPHHEQITQHFCIQGWSGVAKWGGVSMETILELVRPGPEARWVVFYSFGEGADGGTYYDAHPIEQMHSELAMVAYDMNDEPLPYGHGAPLRLRNEIQIGFKQVKWIRAIEFVADFEAIAGGEGGYNEDHEFFGYRQSI
ncbi:MAG: molybdopterin-dependent oxidoreductase [Candidatus Microthrix sp.]|nr:molybdopterin-dependent oxidoreductase [Candidatus Microthrix sp.]